MSSKNVFHARFAVADGPFQKIELTDPVPLGRQIVEASGVRKVAKWSLFAIMPSGDFEDVRLNEPFDLRGKGAERFIGFETDELMKFMLNDSQILWGAATILGETLYRLAEPAEHEAVFLDMPGGTDRLIERDETLRLDEPGIERFITGPRPPVDIEIIVNTRARLVRGPSVTFEEIVALAFPGHHDANVTFSMTYRKAASAPHAGELGAGGSVTIKQGTVFNVTRTVQS